MLSSGWDWYPNWRNAHYIDDLDRVLKVSEVSDGHPLNESASKHWPDASVLAVIRRKEPTFDSPTTSSSTSNRAGSLNSSPTSVMSWTSTGNSQTAEGSSQTISPTTMSQASVSPTSQVSDTSTTSVSCPECSMEFKGSQQDAISNRRRHMQTTQKHNKTKTRGLKCPQPECREKGPMRSDNLGPHLQNVHKMASLSERQSVIEKSKSSVRRVDSDGVARRKSRRNG